MGGGLRRSAAVQPPPTGRGSGLLGGAPITIWHRTGTPV